MDIDSPAEENGKKDKYCVHFMICNQCTFISLQIVSLNIV